MNKLIAIFTLRRDQRGVTFIVVAVALFFLLGFAALAIDFGYSHVVRNQLQNAADSGALAGANDLFDDEGDINLSANKTAYDAAKLNKSGGNSVEVNDYATNTGDVQRGHWTFGDPVACPALGGKEVKFCPNDSPNQIDLFDSNIDYDTDTRFINAVKVVTHNTQIPSFFAKIFGYGNYQRMADAVAVRTAAGRFEPGEFDLPIAICEFSIKNFGTGSPLTCGMGRMLNSGSKEETHNTGGWTNFSQPDCITANPSNIPRDCTRGVSPQLVLGDMGTVGGVQDVVFEDIRDCFFSMPKNVDKNGDEYQRIDEYGNPYRPLNVTLPVIKCEGNNVSNCSLLMGGVNINIIWISETGTGQLTAPILMWKNAFGDSPVDPWDPSDLPDGTPVEDVFEDFAGHFNLTNYPAEGLAPLQKKAIYFMPSCEEVDPIGNGASSNWYGIFSETSVLVE
jgi:hypothetical protein